MTGRLLYISTNGLPTPSHLPSGSIHGARNSCQRIGHPRSAKSSNPTRQPPSVNVALTVLHVVRAWDLATPILDADAGQRPVLLHSFSPRGLNGQPWKRWNAWFSFRASRLTHADPALVELITGLPTDRLLIESDAHPDNHSIGGAQAQVNRCLSDSVRAIAAILQKDPAEIESRTDANFALWCAACREA
mgnify:CR=1 FL=1